MFNPAFNFALFQGLGHQWRPCAGAAIDTDPALNFTRFAKAVPIEWSPATYPYGSGIGTMPEFFPMMDAVTYSQAIGRKPSGPNYNPVPPQPALYATSMTIFPTLPKQGG